MKKAIQITKTYWREIILIAFMFFVVYELHQMQLSIYSIKRDVDRIERCVR